MMFLENPIVMSVLLAFIPIVFILVYALVTLYGEMKVAAHIQNRLAYMENGWHGTLTAVR
jgi:NADH:ubiquinone oxidoreductase subunit H